MKNANKKLTIWTWIARVMVFIVFFWNVQSALEFIMIPEGSIASYELAGVSGIVALQGIGVAFLMWNATYPVVIFKPIKFMVVYGIVLVQQIIGLIGESYILSTIPLDYYILRGSIIRFIIFDGAGFIMMVIPFIFLLICNKKVLCISDGRKTSQ
jgi:hypothetical protein